MSINDTDVVARLRAAADQVEEHGLDAHEVLAVSRRSLRRRRSWQAVSACTTAAAVAFSVALAGPVPVPGLGDVTLPGSEQMRELFGLAEAEAEASGCAVPEPAVRRTPDPEAPASTRPRVTYHLTDARPLSTCFDVRIDDTLPADPGLTPETVTEAGAFWRASQLTSEDENDGYLVSYQVFGTDEVQGELTGDKNTLVTGLTAHGRRAAWYEFTGETPDELVNAPYTLRTAGTASGSIRTIAEIPRRDTSNPVMTDERIAWRHGTTVSVAPTDGSEQPRPLARQATAVGSDSDEIVVATLGQDADGFPTTTFTSYADDGSVTTLLTVNNPGNNVPVSTVDITDDVLTYAFGSDLVTLTVVPRVDGIVTSDEDQTIAVWLTDIQVAGLSAAGDTVVWVAGPVAYLLRDTAPSRADGPDLVRLGQSGPRERMMVGLAGDRIAWSTTEGSLVTVNVGTLLKPGKLDTATSTSPTEPGSRGRAVPAAPTVTVPEDAMFRTYD